MNRRRKKFEPIPAPPPREGNDDHILEQSLKLLDRVRKAAPDSHTHTETVWPTHKMRLRIDTNLGGIRIEVVDEEYIREASKSPR